MEKEPANPFVNGVETDDTKQMSRRDFLKTVTAVGGSVIIGSQTTSHAFREFSGWPGRYGMLTDLTECVGCRSCEKACNEANNLPAPQVPFDDGSVYTEKRRPTAQSYTVVNRYENPKNKEKPIYRKIQCNHCNEPSCASACPIHAYSKTPEGAVLYDPEKCFGCRYCMVACPFYAPAYDYESAFEPKIVKCVLCYDRIKAGSIPACAEACPVQAVTFGRRKDLLRLAKKRIAKNPGRYIDHIYGENEAGGTSWLYLSGVPFELLDFPTNIPSHPPVEEVKGFLAAVPVVFTVWPAFFGMCYTALRHRNGLGIKEKETEEKEEEKR